MLLPQTAEYALRAVIHIAACERAMPGALVRVPDIAGAVDVPRNYLSKTLHQLARAGVLASSRGPTGGFRLAVPPEALTFARVVGPFAEQLQARRCLLGRGPCGENPDCPVHARWKPVVGGITRYFETTTIADALDGRVDAPLALPLAADAEGVRDGCHPSPL